MFYKKRNQVRKLKKKYKEKYAQTLEFILNDQTEKAEENWKWLELSQKVINSKGNRFLPPFVIGLLGLLLLSFSFLPIGKTQVHVSLETSFVAVLLSENSTSGISLSCSELDINSVSRIVWGFRKWDENELDEAVLSVAGKDNLKLEVKELHKSATLTLSANSKVLDIYLGNDSIRGDVVIRDGRLMVGKLGIDTAINTFIPESITFQAKSIGVPIQFETTEAKDMEIHNLIVEKVNFDRQVSSGEFESGIVTGSVVFPATGYEYELNSGNVVDMELDESAPITMTFLGDRMQLEFEAVVSKLHAGPKMFTRSLKPSWIDYFHKNEKVAFYGTAIVWIWGMLWSFKKTVFE